MDGSTAPIRSKLAPPRLRGPTVERPRLYALLDAAAERAVTLVSCAPGYGKSVSVARWLATRRLAAAWVTADASDNDPLRLWSYIVAGIEQALPGVGAAARERLGAGDSTADPAIEVLAGELEADGRPLVIVIDDLDRVTNPRRLATITHAARALPESVRLVLVTRSDPALPLPRWRANRQLAELRAADLALTRDEAAELLAAVERLELRPEQLETIVERTDGWPVAVHLAALRLKRTGAPLDGFTGRHRDMARYLATEIVADLDDELRSFLARTSVLPRLCAGLCDHVLEIANADELLERVAQENLFLVALDEEGVWFRYQALFAEYLRAPLDGAGALQLRAAEWFREHGLIEDAVDQYAAGGETRAIAELIETHHLELARSGRAATIERWIEHLPPESLTARPGVLTAGMLAAGGRALPRDDALRMLSLADLAREADPPRWTPYHEATRLLLRSLYGDDDVGQAVEFARRALAVTRADAGQLEAVAMSLLAFSLLLAGAPEADELARETIVHPLAAVSPYALAGALATRALAAALDGRPRVAAMFAERAAREAELAGIESSIPVACANFAEALVALHRRAADRRRARVAARAHDPARDRVRRLHAWLTVALAEISAARGRFTVAERTLAEARELLAGCADPGRVTALADAADERLRALRDGAARPVEPLSKSEIAVLRLFDEDRSARAIGAELYLSLNTVKTHIRAIYRKLAVNSREDALARGEELGLL